MNLFNDKPPDQEQKTEEETATFDDAEVDNWLSALTSDQWDTITNTSTPKLKHSVPDNSANIPNKYEETHNTNKNDNSNKDENTDIEMMD